MKRIKSRSLILNLISIVTLSLGLQAQESFKLSLVSYNVENLFDNEHDEGKEDYAFLPLTHPLKDQCEEISSTPFYLEQCQNTDWSVERLSWKLENLSQVLEALPNTADIIALSEIENANVVAMLAKRTGFAENFLVTNGPDKRGVDVAILYNKNKLKLLGSKEIVIEEDGLVKPTRNILRASFKLQLREEDFLQSPLSSYVFHVYANHWPSQAAPSEARVAAAKTLKKDIESLRQDSRSPENEFFVVMGDFNTLPTDSPHPFKELLTDKTSWEGALVDAESFSRQAAPSINNRLLPGSYWFGRDQTWNKLDRIFVSQNITHTQGPELIPTSFFILKKNFFMQPFRPNQGPHAGHRILIPKRFNSTAATQADMGFSDHLPIGVDLRIK
jgi:hypothetical protein